MVFLAGYKDAFHSENFTSVHTQKNNLLKYDCYGQSCKIHFVPYVANRNICPWLNTGLNCFKLFIALIPSGLLFHHHEFPYWVFIVYYGYLLCIDPVYFGLHWLSCLLLHYLIYRYDWELCRSNSLCFGSVVTP